uniref:Uncharacterized protein n=1 Tax=Anopheles minimus TaxID=112268 RepID=A0A182WMX4_9DIPT
MRLPSMRGWVCAFLVWDRHTTPHYHPFYRRGSAVDGAVQPKTPIPIIQASSYMPRLEFTYTSAFPRMNGPYTTVCDNIYIWKGGRFWDSRLSGPAQQQHYVRSN